MAFRNRLISLYVLVFIVGYPAGLMSQTCNIKQYGRSYLAEGAGYQHSFFATTDGNFIMAGPVNGKLLLMKINADGDTLWVKHYSPVDVTMSGFFMRALQGKDGMIYCMASNNYLLKLDPNGNVIWAKKISLPNQGYYYFVDFAQLDNGDFAFLLEQNGYYLVRMKADASAIVWSKYFYQYDNYFRGLTIDGNKIIVAGTVAAQVKLFCFNASDGIVIGEKAFIANNRTMSVQSVFNYAGGYMLNASYYLPSSAITEDNHVAVRLDKSFHVINAFSYTNISRDALLDYVMEPDGSFYLGYGSYLPKLLYVSKRDSLLWSRSNYNMFLNNNYHLLKTSQGLMQSSGDNYTGVATGVGYWNYGVSKTDLNGLGGNCGVQDVSLALLPVSVQDKTLPITVSDKNDITIETASCTVLDAPVTISTNCLVQKSCNSLSISGPGTFCGSTSVALRAMRNNGCSLPVQWTIEGNNTDNQVLNDSALSVQFLQNGNYRVIASMSGGCTAIADTIDIRATVIAPTAIQLGPDTSICAGNTIRLHAGTGFNTYAWQDMSADSVFTVSQPGLYFVAASDACSNVYRDTVSVTAAPAIDFDLGPDLRKCNMDTIRIAAPAGFSSYSWSPTYNITSSNTQHTAFFPAVTTYYSVTVEKQPGCFAKDSILITVNHSIPVNLGADTAICTGDSIRLDAGPGFVSYAWSNGSTTASVTVKQKGNYIVTAIDANDCRSSDTFQLVKEFSNPLVILNHDPVICKGGNRLLDAGPGFSSYQWSTGSTMQKIGINSTGLYKVLVTSLQGCKAGDSTLITTIEEAPSNFLPADTAVCKYGKIEIQSLQKFSSFLWNTNEKMDRINVSKAGYYVLTVTDTHGCIGKDSIVVSAKDCLEGFFVPTSFTPNSDGKNDIFKPIVLGKISSYRFTVFNRWGEKVFETTDPQAGWNGFINGNPQFNSGFVWVCRFQFEGQAQRIEKELLLL